MAHTHPQIPNSQKPGLHPVIVRLFRKRAMDQQAVEDFLSWDLKKLPDLTAMNDMEKGANRIIEAVEKKQKIAIYGDYDVDGTTSCALFYHFFKMLNVKVELIQPSRFIEGYGIHPPAIDAAKEKGIDLLITVDCGITNNEAADYAKEIGIDLIITDHHKDAREELPAAYAVINPNRRDEPEDSPLRPLAGVGVAFAICVKVKTLLDNAGQNMPSLYPLLTFVAVGTICDLARLTPVNLKLVRHGLRQLPKTTFPGLLSFLSPEERKLNMTPSEKLSFNIGPLINSKGRLDHPERALKLLIAKDGTESFEHYSHLEVSNRDRKLIQAEVFKEAKEQVLKAISSSEHAISIVYAPEWHEGVIGIVASKLVEEFKVPAIVFTNSEQEGILKASARSAGELNIFDALNAHIDLFTKFGGHKAAAGLSMPSENLETFKTSMNEYLANVPAIERTVETTYDIEVAPHEITPQLVKNLELLEPFGMGNAKPIFKMTGAQLESYDLLKDIHVRWNFKAQFDDRVVRLKGISFNYVGKWDQPHPQELYDAQIKGEELTTYFTLGINRFNGNEYIQLMVDRIQTESF